jgi:spore photoproduct lyase
MSPRKLYVDQKVADSPDVISIAQRLNVPLEIVASVQEVYDCVSDAEDPVAKGKTVLFLTRNKGVFIKSCPGTRSYICCGYKILHIGTFCHMDCSYCILQSYFHPPVLQFFMNHADLHRELAQLFSEKKITRIGTGEFTDSLIWELWTDLSRYLVPTFATQQCAILELKTKTTAIAGLRELSHNRKTIAAWSLNSDRIIAEEELGTATLSARLKAAAKCAAWGYPLAFHFDPILIYEGCIADYRKAVRQIFAFISPQDIVWISLGTFRFMPSLKHHVETRFPSSKIVYGEFVTGLDGKMRYFKPLRIKIYQEIIACIREFAPQVLIYLCMEDEEVWQKSLGFNPSDQGGLSRMLDQVAMQHCGLVCE